MTLAQCRKTTVAIDTKFCSEKLFYVFIYIHTGIHVPVNIAIIESCRSDTRHEGKLNISYSKLGVRTSDDWVRA